MELLPCAGGRHGVLFRKGDPGVDVHGFRAAPPGLHRAKGGKGVRPGSKIRYLLADGKGRAMGFLDGNEMPDFSRYEEMLREAEEELLGPVRGHDAPAR
ncbi:MAG: hypothetical protein HZB63_01825 [Deltaproteobacteria bacterium]|nr:hypothetical protein [Deltaproteobacteria bacterium]